VSGFAKYCLICSSLISCSLCCASSSGVGSGSLSRSPGRSADSLALSCCLCSSASCSAGPRACGGSWAGGKPGEGTGEGRRVPGSLWVNPYLLGGLERLPALVVCSAGSEMVNAALEPGF
jgi:hypothetical protein